VKELVYPHRPCVRLHRFLHRSSVVLLYFVLSTKLDICWPLTPGRKVHTASCVSRMQQCSDDQHRSTVVWTWHLRFDTSSLQAHAYRSTPFRYSESCNLRKNLWCGIPAVVGVPLSTCSCVMMGTLHTFSLKLGSNTESVSLVVLAVLELRITTNHHLRQLGRKSNNLQ